MSNHPLAAPQSPIASVATQARAFIEACDAFFFTPSVPYTHAAIRVMAGLMILYIHFCFSFWLGEYVGPRAWITQPVVDMLRVEATEYPSLPMDWVNDPSNPSTIYKGMTTFSIFYHVTDMPSVWLVHAGILAANLMLVLGFMTRFAAVATWIGAISYIQRAQTSLFGLDTLTSIFLFYLCLAPCGAVWSVDSWLAARRARRLGLPAPKPVATSGATFVQRLMQIHFAIIYIGAGTSKLMGNSWWGGTAVWGVMANSSFAPLEFEAYYQGLAFLCRHRWLWEIVMSSLVVFTLVVELGLPFIVWFPRARWIIMCGSLLLHTGIGYIMGLTVFGISMVVLLFAFVPSEKAKLMWEHLTGSKPQTS